MNEIKFTNAVWSPVYMVDEDSNELTPTQLGEYFKNSIKQSAEHSDSVKCIAITADVDGSTRDVCLVGNGPTSFYNACLIRSAPALYKALDGLLDVISQTRGEPAHEAVHQALRALADARGEE